MAKSVNRLRNPNFSKGGPSPNHWTLHRRGTGVSFRRTTDGVAVLQCKRAGSIGTLSQVVRCKPGEYYRVEAVVRGSPVACSEEAGAFLSIRPIGDGRPRAEARRTPPVRGVADWVTVRAYFHAPPEVREAEVGVGLVDAVGSVEVRTVRFIHVLEPEEESHPLALLPPPHATPPPIVVKRVCVCARSAGERPIVELLSLRLGRGAVFTSEPKDLRPARFRADGLLLPDPTPPPGLRSLDALEALATQRAVVISLSAFEKLAKGRVRFRRIEQPDDPMHAKVEFSNFATAGFALHDVFPFAAPGKKDGSSFQNQFRKTPELAALCKKRGYFTLLSSVCHSDATTGHPISLFKMTTGGVVVVLDIDPLEGTPSTFGEPTPGLHLLGSILGCGSPGLGQFTVPARTQTSVRELIREMANRFTGFNVHDEDVPADKIETQLVTIGGEEQSFGLPIRPRPVILVRSGLTYGDVESVYACWTWFKQLVRPAPHACPYADALASKFRLAWVPIVAEWELREGWRRSGSPPTSPMDLDMDDAGIAALIDVSSHPVNQQRVVFAREGEMCERAGRWLQPLLDAFGPTPDLAYSVPTGTRFEDRSLRAWRCEPVKVSVECAGDSFGDELHGQVLDAGGEVVRIELPGDDSDFSNQSVVRTAVCATMLEHVVGLCFGLIGVNRGVETRVLDGFAPIKPGQAIVLELEDRALQTAAARTG